MAYYDKKVIYLSEMEYGNRIKGAGFVRMECRGESCSFDMHISGMKTLAERKYDVAVVSVLGKEYPIGRIFLHDGGGEWKEVYEKGRVMVMDRESGECDEEGEFYSNVRGMGKGNIFYREIAEILVRVSDTKALVGKLPVWEKTMQAAELMVEGTTAGIGEGIGEKMGEGGGLWRFVRGGREQMSSGNRADRQEDIGGRRDSGRDGGGGSRWESNHEDVRESVWESGGKGDVTESGWESGRKEDVKESVWGNKSKGSDKENVLRSGRKEDAKESVWEGGRRENAKEKVWEGRSKEGIKEKVWESDRKEGVKGRIWESNSGETGREGSKKETELESNNREIRRVNRNGEIGKEKGNKGFRNERGIQKQLGKESKKEGTGTEEKIQIDDVILNDKWDQLKQIYSVVHPYEDEREYIAIQPKDFVIMTGDYQHLANNSFLLHGFYNYRHIVLGREEDGCFYLGVPGVYYEREKMVALMFGFEAFECDGGKAEAGKFGYYLRKVKI